MDREFTTREKILMVILAVIILGAVYYLFVYAPSTSAIESANSQISQVQSEVSIQEAISAQRDATKSQLEELKSSGHVSQKTPKYDNTSKTVAQINKALKKARTYSLSFQDPEQSEDGSAMRHVCSINYTASSYAAAKSIVEELMDGKYSCLVSDFSISMGSQTSDKEATATVNIIYYERL